MRRTVLPGRKRWEWERGVVGEMGGGREGERGREREGGRAGRRGGEGGRGGGGGGGGGGSERVRASESEGERDSRHFVKSDEG